MEPIDVVPTELDYIRTADISAGAAKYHQNDDVFKTVTDIALVCSAEIRGLHGKIHQIVKVAVLGF